MAPFSVILLSTCALWSSAIGAPPPTPAVAGFLPAVAGTIAADADLFPPSSVADAAACGALCASTAGCISFNLCALSPPQPGAVRCGVQGWSMSYVPESAPDCAWYRRSVPRNDARIVQAVPWALQVPAAGVTLAAGPLSTGFAANVAYLQSRDPLDMLFFFAERAGVPNPPGQCYGWGGWIRGSEAGNFLMGAGNAIRWTNDTLLRANAEAVVAGITEYAQPNGWAWAFNESDITLDNLPDYCSAWVTHGLLEAAGAGVPGALDTARATISLFNNHSLLPLILPPNGGPDPVQPYPSGFNNVTDGGYGQASGHMIYIEYQGMIKHTLMALSEAGTQADVDIVRDHYQEDWWLNALLSMDLFHAIWHRQFFSHNYEVTAFEAFLDMYVLTGNTTYLQAVSNAWTMLREHWILPGGSFALNEGSYYPPDSYFIGFTGTHVAAAHDHAAHAKRESSGDPYYHAKCMLKPGEGEGAAAAAGGGGMPALKAAGAAARAPPTGGPNDSDPPTGELCGSVFWTKLNQRFHRLYPDNETFVAEMERSIFNVGLAAMGLPGAGGEGPNGTGIRYFANQHKAKQLPSMHASCCEGQGTRLFGSIPEFVYTYAFGAGAAAPLTIHVDLFAASAIQLPYPAAGAADVATLAQDTAWPYGAAVALTLTLPAGGGDLDLAVRVPAWLAAPSLAVTVDGAAWPAAGVPGSYLHIRRAWAGGATTVAFSLPMALSAARYAGHSQLPPYQRWSYLAGPILLAWQGSWNSSVDALVLPPAVGAPGDPAAWLAPVSGSALHWTVPGAPGVTVRPYFEIQDSPAPETFFSVYPCFS